MGEEARLSGAAPHCCHRPCRHTRLDPSTVEVDLGSGSDIHCMSPLMATTEAQNWRQIFGRNICTRRVLGERMLIGYRKTKSIFSFSGLE